MQTTDSTNTPTAKMRSYRARLRSAGLRPVQIWVPDVRAGRLADEARRQSLVAAGMAEEHDVLTFIEVTADMGHSE